MKIANLGDTHFTDEPPSTRTDTDFFATQMGKFDFAIATCLERGVSVLTQSGDLFDRRRVSNRVLSEIARRLRRLKANGIEFVCTLGQHDVKAYQYATYQRDSDVAILEAAGLLTVLTSGRHAVFGDAAIYGYGIRETATAEFLEGRDDPEIGKGYTRIALVHASVGDAEIKDVHGNVIQADIADQNLRSAHWACFGDIHNGFEPHRFDSGLRTIAFSCGTMTRMKIDQASIAPRLAIIDTDPKGVEFIEIPHSLDRFAFEPEKVDREESALAFKARLARSRTDQEKDDRTLVSENAALFDYTDVESLVLANMDTDE